MSSAHTFLDIIRRNGAQWRVTSECWTRILTTRSLLVEQTRTTFDSLHDVDTALDGTMRDGSSVFLRQLA